MEYFEYMDTILCDYYAELAMEEDFDMEDPYDGLDPEDEGWEEPDIDFDPYMGYYMGYCPYLGYDTDDC